MTGWRLAMIATVLTGLALLTAACGNAPDEQQTSAETDDQTDTDDETETDGDDAGTGDGDQLSGSIAIDGSSTVGPLTDAVAEEYAAEQPDVTVNLSISGSGGGFERFCGTGDTHISNASRPITDEEAELCEENGIDYIEVRVGTDALTMVTNPQTDFVQCLTTEEAAAIWGGEEAAQSWSDVRSDLPDEEISIFAPDTDSGTYDFFTETILGEEEGAEEPISDYNASADDNIIAQGIIGTPASWGYFGFAYYQSNSDQLKALEYDAGDGCVAPSAENVQNDSYQLARPLFIYIKESSIGDEAHVADFATFYLDNVSELISSVGYIPAPEEAIQESQDLVAEASGA